MTWAEFKNEMEANGVMDEDELAYIDWGSPYEIVLRRHKDGSIYVYSGGDREDHEEEPNDN